GAAGAVAEEETYVTVRMGDDVFLPEVLRVPTGTKIEWVNAGRNPHNVTADDGGYGSANLAPGEEFAHDFTEPGVYRFTCTLHGVAGVGGMVGMIVVGDVAIPTEHGDVSKGREPVPTAPGTTIHVPADQPTVQAGVDAAAPGDLVLIAPGVYQEAVQVTTPYVTIRGEDRDTTILDGDLRLSNGIHVIEADGVAVENLTARHYVVNGVYWTGVQGFRGSYLTAYANGDYGIYAFDSTWGRFEHSYGGGHPDSGFYVGQCDPCHIVVTDVLSEGNALGFSGTNASGDMIVANSEWRDNLGGIAPNTLDSEALAPGHDLLVAGNWVHDNSNRHAPAKQISLPALGIGIFVTGVRDDVIRANLVEGHSAFGIVILPNVDDNLWLTSGTRVEGNLVRDSGQADLALGAPGQGGDCFTGNDHSTSIPIAIEVVAGCDGGPRAGSVGAAAPTVQLLAKFMAAIGGDGTDGDWRTWPAPSAQPEMPDASAGRWTLAVPEVAVPGTVEIRDLAAVVALAAAAPAAIERSTTREVTVLGVSLSSSPLGMGLALYAYLLPALLYVTWVAVAAWDLARREDASVRRRSLWLLAVLAIPILGPIAYLAAGGSPIPGALRATLVIGGAFVYLVATILIAVLLVA
ncbi:MAG: cupredoxin domain-containing protein, partial [Candidatus Limnocylindrales bacterium]